MLILERGRVQYTVGRFNLIADSFQRVCFIRPKQGGPPDPIELTVIKRFLRYHRKDIVNPHVMTGWQLDIEGEIPLTGVTLPTQG